MICPLFFQVSRYVKEDFLKEADPGSSWGKSQEKMREECQCLKNLCAWYDKQDERCAVITIARKKEEK